MVIMLWNYQRGYDGSISWNVTTKADIVEFPAWSTDRGLMEHQIIGERYLLNELYSGSKIERSYTHDYGYLGMIWIGICILLVLSTYFNRYYFFGTVAAFALFINRLNLFEVGLFGVQSKLVMLLPFLGFLIPLVIFHEYQKKTPFIVRIVILLLISGILCVGIEHPSTFIDHFIAHSLFGLAILSLLFIFLVSEEFVFFSLYAVSSSKGGKNNHLHFTLLCMIYLGNLTLYYLNKSGIYENSFFFFDPYILLAISSVISLWSFKFKDQYYSRIMPEGHLIRVFSTLGMITFCFLSLSMNRGMDTIPQSFHYFILYAHLGFGFLFFLYIISNFLDPLIKGFEVYKIAYRERNFPYLSARLGGMVAIMAFFFLSGQEPYNLLRSGYYSFLSVKEKNLGNELLGKEYLINAEFLGFNAHFPNYMLAWEEWDRGNDFRAKLNFYRATQRYPSPYAFVNYGNLEKRDNPTKVQAVYEESLRRMESPEMTNNLGLIHLENGEYDKALSCFEEVESSTSWNNAPLLNKWATYFQTSDPDSTVLVDDYEQGNFGVKANILASEEVGDELSFDFKEVASAPILHRQAYLINSSHVFEHDSIEHFLRREIAYSTNGSTNERLAKSLALYLYKKGKVNEAFRVYDDLLANTNEVYKGKYFDELGKLALDQQAYKLADDYFARAIKGKYHSSRVNRIETLAALGRKDLIVKELSSMIQRDPSLTNQANNLLKEIDDFVPPQKSEIIPALEELKVNEIVSLARQNAFNEETIFQSIAELNKRDSIGHSYDILVEAIEINPYSTALLQEYTLTALEWNLHAYASQSMERLEALLDEISYSEFQKKYEERKAELEKENW